MATKKNYSSCCLKTIRMYSVLRSAVHVSIGRKSIIEIDRSEVSFGGFVPRTPTGFNLFLFKFAD